MNQNDEKDIESRKHVHRSIARGKEVEKTKLQKAVGVLLSEDLDSIKGSIMDDYIKPRFRDYVKETIRKGKEAIIDSSTSALEIMLFGDSKKKNKTGEYNGQKINYVSYYTGGSGYEYNRIVETPKPDPHTRLRIIYILDDEKKPSYKKAQEVITDLLSIAKRYPAATVADYYQLVGFPTTKQDYMFGWNYEMIRDIDVSHDRNGYFIVLPKPMPLD